MAPRQRGRVDHWVADQGYGFIKPDGNGQRLYVHASSVRDGSSLAVGQRVSFKLRPNERNKYDDAIEVRASAHTSEVAEFHRNLRDLLRDQPDGEILAAQLEARYKRAFSKGLPPRRGEEKLKAQLKRAEEAGVCVLNERSKSLFVCSADQPAVRAPSDLGPAISWLRTALLEPVAQRHGVRLMPRQGHTKPAPPSPYKKPPSPCMYGFKCYAPGCSYAHPHGRLIDDNRAAADDDNRAAANDDGPVLVGHLTGSAAIVRKAAAAAKEKLDLLHRHHLPLPRRPGDDKLRWLLTRKATELTDTSVLVLVSQRGGAVEVSVTGLFRCRECFDDACQQLTSVSLSWGSDSVPFAQLVRDALGPAAYAGDPSAAEQMAQTAVNELLESSFATQHRLGHAGCDGHAVVLVGSEQARASGRQALVDHLAGRQTTVVELQWPDTACGRAAGRLFARGRTALYRRAVAVLCEHTRPPAAVEAVSAADLPGDNPLVYARVKGPPLVVDQAVPHVKGAVQALLDAEVVDVQLQQLSPSERRYLTGESVDARQLREQVESEHEVVVHDSGGSSGGGSSGGGGGTPTERLTADRDDGLKVVVSRGDLTRSGCTVVVNSANKYLDHAAGAAKAIADAAGPALVAQDQQHLSRYGGALPTGSSHASAAGQLRPRGTKLVAQTVCPVFSDPKAPPVSLMRQAVEAALNVAQQHSAASIAFPLLGSGVYQWPKDKAADVVVGAAIDWCEAQSAARPALEAVHFVDISEEAVQALAAAVERRCGAGGSAAPAAGLAPPVPTHQWWWRDDHGWVQYDWDQNSQLEAEWQRFQAGQGVTVCRLVGDRGGVASQSKHKPAGARSAVYEVRLHADLTQARQVNVVSQFERKVKREPCNEPPPLPPRVASGGRSLPSQGRQFTLRPASHGAGASSGGAAEEGLGSGGGSAGHNTSDVPVVWLCGLAANTQAAADELISLLEAARLEVGPLEVEGCRGLPTQKFLQRLYAICRDVGAHVLDDGQAAGAEYECDQYVAVRVQVLGSAAKVELVSKWADAKEELHRSLRAFPDTWTTQQQQLPCELVDVSLTGSEGQRVLRQLQETMPSAQASKLQRVENGQVWRRYRNRTMMIGGVEDERFLFHGSSNVDGILREGIDCRYSSQGMWGRALYLAVNFSYSHNYAQCPVGDQRRLFLVRTMLGRVKELPSDRNIIKPPEGFDSIKGHTQGSDVFMVYQNDQAYAEYLITYSA